MTFYKQNVYNIHAFMDNDEEGQKAIQHALERNVLEPSDYNLAVCEGMERSELEDLLLLDAYAPGVQDEFGVQLKQPRFRNSDAKWSQRAAKVFVLSGKLWNKSVRMQTKRVVVNSCIQYGPESLNPHRRGPIDTLISTLESKLSAREA